MSTQSIDKRYSPETWHALRYSGANAFSNSSGDQSPDTARDLLQRIDDLLADTAVQPIEDIPTIAQPKPVQHIVVLPEHGISIQQTPTPRVKKVTSHERQQRARHIRNTQKGQAINDAVLIHNRSDQFTLAHTPLSPADTIELSRKLEDERTRRGRQIMGLLYATMESPIVIPLAGENFHDASVQKKSNRFSRIGSCIRTITTRRTKAERLGFSG